MEELIQEKVTEQDVAEMLKLFSDIKSQIDNGTQNFDLKAFATGYANGYGTFTPDMTNSAMKSLNLNPLTATADNVAKALNDAKNNEKLLISYGQDMYIKNMLYKRNFDYINYLPAWNLSIECINAEGDDYNSPKYKKDYKAVKNFLSKFNYRAEFEKAFFNMLNSETYFCMFREDLTPEKFVFQDFPYEYSKITGRSTWGIYYDIDMVYFTQPSIDINMFPAWIKQRFNELFTGNQTLKYIPSNPDFKRDGSFVMWVQTSFEDGFWCFKFKNDLIANVPYFAPMLNDLVLLPVFRNLQVSQSMAAAKKIITSQYPLLKEQRNANVSDMLAVKPTTMGQLLGVFAKGLEESIKILNLPSDKLDMVEFSNTDKTAYSDFLKTTASLMGGGNVLFNTVKNNVEETRLSLNIDEMLATSIYPQFESFLEYQINKLTKFFKFKFKFSGTKTYTNQKSNFEMAFQSAEKGIVCPNKIANALNMNLVELENELDMANNTGFIKKLLPMLNMYTQTNGSGGRPQKSESELSESGSETRGSGSNLSKGGTI